VDDTTSQLVTSNPPLWSVSWQFTVMHSTTILPTLNETYVTPAVVKALKFPYHQYHSTETAVTKVYNDMLLAADNGQATALCLLNLTALLILSTMTCCCSILSNSSAIMVSHSSCCVHIWPADRSTSSMVISRRPLFTMSALWH